MERSAVSVYHLWCATTWTLEVGGAAQLVQTFTRGARTMRFFFGARDVRRCLLDASNVPRHIVMDTCQDAV